jgi:methionine-rich copper-binding protein CopC
MITQGGTASYTITVQSLNGFNSGVSLTALNLPGNQVLPGTGFSPQTLTPPANGSTSATFSFISNTSTPTGTFTITIQGQGAGLTRSTTVSLTVNPAAAPDFSVNAAPSSRTINQGDTTTYTITVTSVSGFIGSVSLAALNLPGNVVLAGTGFSPQTVSVPSGGSATSTFTYVSNTTVPIGTSTVTMQGQGGALTRGATVTLTVNSAGPPDFSVSANVVSRAIVQGDSSTFTLTVQSLNGFNTAVSFFALNLPPGYVAQGTGWSPLSATPLANGTTSSTLTIVTSGSTQPGVFTITLRGTAGGVSRDATVTLTINAPAQTDAATFVSETVGDTTRMDLGQAFTKSWTVHNSGTTTWNSNYKLRWVGGATLSNHVDVIVNGSVTPGTNYTFSIPMTAPSTAGTFREDWKLTNANGATVQVSGSNTIWVSINVSAITDGATFVTETISDDTVVTPGQNFTKSWTIRNSGTTTWNSGYRLRWISSTGASLSTHNDVLINGAVPPGSTYTFSVSMVAPTSAGNFREDWQFASPNGATIQVGTFYTIWVSISVTGGVPQSQCGTAEQMRARIQQQLQANNYVVPYQPGQSDIEGLLGLDLPAYDELYFSALRFRGLVQTTLLLSGKFIDQGNLDAACKYLRRAARIFNQRTQLEGAAALVWDTRVSGAQEVAKAVFDESCSIEASLLSVYLELGVTASTGVNELCTFADFAVDKSIYGEDQAFQNLASNIRRDVITTVLHIKLDELGGDTIAQWISKGGFTYNTSDSLVKNLLSKALQKTETTVAIKQALTALGSATINERVDYYTNKLISSYLDGLSGGSQSNNSPRLNDGSQHAMVSAPSTSVQLESSPGPQILSTNPTRSAVLVSTSLTTINVNFSELIQAGTLSITMTDTSGNSIPLQSVTVQNNSLTASIVGQLTLRGVYTVSVGAGAIQDAAGLSNDAYQWTFSTSLPPLSVGSNVQVANTGGLGISLRSTPAYLADGSNIIGVLPEGTRLKIIGGPQQSGGYTWWNVAGSQVGWSAVGDWLIPNDGAGLRIGAQVTVNNTGGLGLPLRDEPGLSGTITKTLAEGTSMRILSGPYLVDGFVWWNISGDAGGGFSAVAYWLFPDISSTSNGIGNLTVASSAPNSGTSMIVSPNDINGAANGTTQFTRVYNNGSTVNLTASATASGGSFVKWQRDSADWSFSQSTTVTVDANHTMTAVYAAPTTIQVVIQTNPDGRSIMVDGATYSTKQTFSWVPASSHTIGVSSPLSGGTGTQYVWNGWSDNGAIAHAVAPTSNTTYTANIVTQYALTIAAGTGGSISPATNWFNSGQAVSISAVPNVNFAFTNWTGVGPGSFTGTNNPATVTMNGPITETANFVQAQFQLVLDQSSPSLNQAAALDSVLLVRDPFPVVNGTNLFSRGTDRNTRVMLFVNNLQLGPGENSSSVVVNLKDGNNQSFDVAAEDFETVPGFDFSQLVFRLPDNLAVGACTIQIKAHGQVSNAGIITIRN